MLNESSDRRIDFFNTRQQTGKNRDDFVIFEKILSDKRIEEDKSTFS
jgi:hypothetical protein